MNLYLFASYDEAEYTIKTFEMVKVEDQLFEIYKNENSYLVLTKIGLINAAMCATYILTKYQDKIKLVINAGLAGSENIDNDLNVEDIVLVDKAYIGHNDATCFGYLKLQTPQMPQLYTTHKSLKICKNIKQKNIISTNVFIDSQQKYKLAVDGVENIDLFDMEAAAIAQTCYRFKINCIIVKIVSDVLEKKDSKTQFDLNLTNCSKKLASFLKSLQGENYGM